MSSSPWTPLKRPLFRDRWVASVVSNTGTWMQDTAATWLMTSLTSSPLLIALMLTAASLPVLLLGLPAGALADILDRRRLLIFWQSWMLVAAVLLSVMTLGGGIGPWSLVGLTLALNVGAAMNNPAWQAIVPELVPRDELAQAISLNSVAFNLARAVGPALGGLMMAAFVNPMQGAAAVFLVNGATFLFVIAILYRWKRKPLQTSELPTERFVGSIRAGVRYVGHARPILGILMRAGLVTSCVSAMWALLAVVAGVELRHGALGYGLLNGCLGLGAVAGALVLPRFRARLSADALVSRATLLFVAALLVLAFVHSTPLVAVALLLAGGAWISTTSTFNVAVQEAVPAWVQARALGTYQMVFQGGLAIGSAAWGVLAEHSSTRVALALASLGLLAGLPLARRFPIASGQRLDLSPVHASGLARAAPLMVIEPKPDEGPVLISIAYTIDPAQAEPYAAAMHELKHIRLRDGAMRWGLFRDPVSPAHYVETFLVESWAEYLRQRERMTMHDLELRSRAYAFQKGEMPPPISRMIYAGTSGAKPEA